MFGLFKKKIEYVEVTRNNFDAYNKAILGGNLRITLGYCRLYEYSGIEISIFVLINTSHEVTADFWRKRLKKQGLEQCDNKNCFRKVMHLKEFDEFVTETFNEQEEVNEN
ncbi:hypothetical protein [Enterococcus gallinarum]|uniref:Uncharacterized protein n=1 Tax=Enterococcus gallinarum TaxID=1353 RepID=A0A366U4R5_ENTGA|nr:hypothetical protein [Enterococcus gallinarum]MBM6742692.1 hypothetical protein [Enterococcus gallinarum]QOG26796.1 hypothetical protein EGM181_05765 [Enterococcus gallinarum]QOG26858.1 hypothetical protein EGM181_06100 [Enterococcus gallinarum]RBT38401.1 hypothetical protein EB54_02536 [Enterococcus gallinarum]RBT38467.1 hypothetical protein EB54_02602 [Enterococcus gallinarum]